MKFTVTILHVVGRVKLRQEDGSLLLALQQDSPPHPARPAPRNPTPQRGLHPFPEVSLSWPALILSGSEHGADAPSLLARSPKGEWALQPQRAWGNGVRFSASPFQRPGKVPEGRSKLETPDLSAGPFFCSPGWAWLEAHSGSLMELDRGCPILPPPGGPRPLASHQGRAAGPQQVLISSQRGGPLCGNLSPGKDLSLLQSEHMFIEQ